MPEKPAQGGGRTLYPGISELASLRLKRIKKSFLDMDDDSRANLIKTIRLKRVGRMTEAKKNSGAG